MGADNHPTTVPTENSADIEYDDSPHDRYMKRLASEVGE